MNNQITNPKTTEVLNCAKVLLDSNNPQGARALLDTIPENERTGEWYYLLGKTESVPPQTPTVNANVNLSFNKKPKEVKPKKPPKKKSSSSTIQKEIQDLKQIIRKASLPIFIVFLIVVVAFYISVQKQEKEREERINRVRASAIRECEQYCAEYKKNPYTFQYIELSDYKLDAAIQAAQNYGHRISSFDKYDFKRAYTQLKFDEINRMFNYLPQQAEGYYPEQSQLKGIIACIDFLKVLQPFYDGPELNQLISQREKMETTLAWAEAAVRASYPELYVD